MESWALVVLDTALLLRLLPFRCRLEAASTFFWGNLEINRHSVARRCRALAALETRCRLDGVIEGSKERGRAREALCFLLARCLESGVLAKLPSSASNTVELVDQTL